MRRRLHHTNCSGNPRSVNRGPRTETSLHQTETDVPPSLDRFAPKISWRNPNDLVPAQRNARTHTDKQIAQIAASIERFGFVNPILIGDDGQIIAGHGRVSAAKQLGLNEVPVIRLDHLSDAERRAYVVADNRLAELSGWDRDLLAVELQELSEIDLGFDVELTGFETAEIDLLIENRVQQDDAADTFTTREEFETPTTQTGDLWMLGDHRLICGNALDPTVFKRVMGDEEADTVFTDPPYNVPIDKHVCGLGAIQHREFAMASGEMSEAEFIEFLQNSLTNIANYCRDGSLLYVCIDWRHLYEILSAARNANLPAINLCVWAKSNAGMGSFYRSQHELVLVLKKGTAPHTNNVQLGRYGRYRTNVWRYEGANSIRSSRREELALHPTVKPVALVADAIKDVTQRGDLVLDGFAGSGTTILAAQKTGRRCCAIELDPRYVDVAIRRWQALTGDEAIHAENGLTFEQLAASRSIEPARRTRKRRKPTTAGC